MNGIELKNKKQKNGKTEVITSPKLVPFYGTHLEFMGVKLLSASALVLENTVCYYRSNLWDLRL